MGSNNLEVKISAEVTDLQQKFAVARAETSALSAEMNKLAKASAAGTLDTAGQSQFAQIAQQYLQAKSAAAGYSAQIRENVESNKSFGDSIDEARGKMSTLFQVTGAAAAYEAVMKVGQAIMAIGDKAQNILTMSEVLGITTAQFQAMGVAAEEAGTSQEVLAHANEKLTETIREAQANDGAAIVKLKELGLTNEQIIDPTLDLNKALMTIGPLLNDAATKAAEMQAAVALLGARGAIAAAVWEHYDGSARGVAAANESVNATLKSEDVALAAQGVKLHELLSYWGNTAEKVLLYGEAIAQVAGGSEGAFAKLVAASRDADAALQKLNHPDDRSGQIQRTQELTEVTVSAQRMITAATLQGEQEQVEAAAAGSAQRLAAARKYYEDSKNYYPDAAVPAVEAAYRQMISAGKEFDDARRAGLAQQLADAKEKDSIDTANYRESLAQMKEASKDFETIDRQNADADIAIARSTLEAKKSILDSEVAATAQASAAKFAALRDLVNQEYALDQEALQNELKGLEDQPAAYNRVYNEIRELKAKNVQDLAALDQQAAAASRKAAQQDSQAWQDGVREIESAESTLVGDLVSRRKTLGASLVQVGAQFVQQEIANDIKAMTTKLLLASTEANSEKALEQGGLLFHLMSQGELTEVTVTAQKMQTQAVIAGNQMRTAATASGAASSKAAGAAANGSVVMADAAKAFSGTYASVAQIPYVGWLLAPAAGAAAFAAVAGYESLASLDVGTSYVPRDMPAFLHQGEAVLPRPMADTFRQGGLGGDAEQGAGGDIHIHNHITAWDHSSVEGMVKSPAFRQTMIDAAKMHFSRGGR